MSFGFPAPGFHWGTLPGGRIVRCDPRGVPVGEMLVALNRATGDAWHSSDGYLDQEWVPVGERAGWEAAFAVGAFLRGV